MLFSPASFSGAYFFIVIPAARARDLFREIALQITRIDKDCRVVLMKISVAPLALEGVLHGR